MAKTYETLNDEEKAYFKEVCDKNFGKTNTFCETGEPLYFTKEGSMVPTQQIIDLLFNTSEN